jgi:hypothetical protein
MAFLDQKSTLFRIRVRKQWLNCYRKRSPEELLKVMKIVHHLKERLAVEMLIYSKYLRLMLIYSRYLKTS